MKRKVVYAWVNGEWVKMDEPAHPVGHVNYIITCHGADWSGYRTLRECLDQEMYKDSPPFKYEIEER